MFAVRERLVDGKLVGYRLTCQIGARILGLCTHDHQTPYEAATCEDCEEPVGHLCGLTNEPIRDASYRDRKTKA